MTYAISSPTRPHINIKGKEATFPVARVICIGRNYSDNVAAETKDEKMTVLFMKDAYMLSPAEEGIFYPKDTTQLRYEIELVVAIGNEGQNITPKEADNYIYGYAVGVDFTKYCAQSLAKQHSWPWERGKSFFGCAPCSQITPKHDVSLKNNKIWLKKNNVEVQHGTLDQMIWSVPEIISLVSSTFGLLPGDLIFTGTPQGIGMTEKGDSIEAGIEGIDFINFQVK